MLSFCPGALICNQSYVFLPRIMVGGGTKFFKLHFLPENAKKHVNFKGFFHVAKYVDG